MGVMVDGEQARVRSGDGCARGLVAKWLCQKGMGRWHVRGLARVRLMGKGAGDVGDKLGLGGLGFVRVSVLGLVFYAWECWIK